MAPSVQKIREVLGTGSNTTIAEHLKDWREEYAKKKIHHLPANMPKELISTFEVLWQTAQEQAQNQLAEYKQVVESEREEALQKEREADKSVADIKLKLEELSLQLAQEIANTQKLNIELAIANDRLTKQDETLTTQKNQYEDRLKRIYEEKDNVIQQNHYHQKEIKTLHEKLALQAEEHKRLIAQQNSLQQQSEIRWLKLIDQARQETKDERKKLENVRHHYEEQFKKTETKLTASQRETHENNAQLKMAQERINQLNQEVKFLETEHIKLCAIIMKLKEEQKLKKDAAPKKSKKVFTVDS